MRARKLFSLCFFIFFLSACPHDSNLVRDVRLSFAKPVRQEQKPIDPILEKYISIGMGKEEVKQFFEAEGFAFSGQESVNDGADTTLYWVRYIDWRFLAPPAYKIVIEVRFSREKVKDFSGVYLVNLY